MEIAIVKKMPYDSVDKCDDKNREIPMPKTPPNVLAIIIK